MLRALRRRALLVDIGIGAADQEPGCQERWYAALGREPAILSTRLARMTAAVTVFDELGTSVAEGLVQAGIGSLRLVGPPGNPQQVNVNAARECSVHHVVSSGFDARVWRKAWNGVDLVVLAVTGELASDPVIADVNRLCYEAGIASLLVRGHRATFWIGPLCVPGTEACCFLEALQPQPERPMSGRSTRWEFSAAVGPRPLLMAAGHVAAAAATDFLALSKRSPLAGRVWVADWAAESFVTYRLLKNPRCPICSRLARHSPEARVLDE